MTNLLTAFNRVIISGRINNNVDSTLIRTIGLPRLGAALATIHFLHGSPTADHENKHKSSGGTTPQNSTIYFAVIFDL